MKQNPGFPHLSQEHSMTETALRAYLLGKLDETEVELVETRLVEDPDLFSQMETAEDDLFDAFARGALDAGDRTRFLERFGANSDRRRFASAFVKRTSSRNVLAFIKRPWLDLAIAATLVIVVGAVVMRRAPESPGPASVSTAPTATAVPVPPAPASVSLSLGSSRAAGGPVKVAIERGADRVHLRIRLNPADKYAVYSAQIRSQADNIVWTDVAVPAADGGDLYVNAVVPADRLPAGTYEIAIRGGATANALDDLGFVTIEVSRLQ
jgi:hypothetical protein